jgi:hypothetical protein
MRTFNFVKAKLKSTCAASLIALLATSLAQAHVTLLDPIARTSDNDLTMDPCGGKPAGPSVAAYTAGTNIEITIDLFVQHRPSLHAVISYDNFATRTELAMISSSGEGIYTMTIPLPNQPLGSAVLQVTNGNYVSCADITLSEGVPFSINAGLNDAWFFPDTGGQGFFIVVFPDIPLLFLAWFTFDTVRPPDVVQAVLGEPGHRWITAQGPFDGDTALLDITVTEGGIFDAGEPRPRNSDPGTVGSMEVVFENCSRGIVKYNIPDLGLMGEIPIQRIANDNVALCEALITQ